MDPVLRVDQLALPTVMERTAEVMVAEEVVALALHLPLAPHLVFANRVCAIATERLAAVMVVVALAALAEQELLVHLQGNVCLLPPAAVSNG